MTDLPENLDALLSAYLDDELSEAERAHVEDLLLADARVADRLEALALADADFIDAAGEINDQPMSPGLAATVESLKARSAEENDNVILFPFWKRSMQFVEDHKALAACAVVAIAAAAMAPSLMPHGPGDWPVAEGEMVLAGSELGSALTTSASGEVFTVSSDAYQPRFSYLGADGACRVVDVTREAEQGRFVTCRRETGWQIEIVDISPRPAHADGEVFSTASGANAPRIEAYLDAAMTDAPLGPADEAALISRNWSAEEEMPHAE